MKRAYFPKIVGFDSGGRFGLEFRPGYPEHHRAGKKRF